MIENELKSKINQLWDKFWSGGISDPLVAITQMSYLIFMKRLEDEDIQREQESQLNGNGYKSLFEGHSNCKWSQWTNLPAEKILVGRGAVIGGNVWLVESVPAGSRIYHQPTQVGGARR